ncbi:MAG: ABC transporter permease [Oscillospiraceae bacterium]|nr:ABC transporter permease [Oscillospiraceae bacterium]
MKAFIAFTKKEFTESLRTYRLVILAAVFLMLGVMSPLIAKIFPELFSGVDMGGGLTIIMPEPTVMDSWIQFFSNVGQMGMLALIISFSGIMANELSRGTLINLLTKGMKRHTVILSKFLSASTLWTASYLLCLAVCYAYTEYYWPGGVLHNAFFAFLAPWLFGEFLIALLILGGVLFGSYTGSLLSCFGVIVSMLILNIFPAAQKYNPIVLAGDTLQLLNAQKELPDFIPAAILCAASVVLLLALSVVAFNKKRI